MTSYSRIFLSSAMVAAATVVLVDATSVKMDFLPVGHARVDPILNEECPSDHVHAFYGPQVGVDPRPSARGGKSLYEALITSDVSENTGNVEENKSMYWHPSVYKYDRKKKKHTRDVMTQTSSYYIWETGKTTAFPEGFRMIGGHDVDKSQAFAECVEEVACDDDDDGDCYSENSFFPTSKCAELEVSMRMPNCWDGENIDSPNSGHTAHVAYAEGSSFDGDCPDTHPVKLPQIQLFFRIVPYDGGWHEFSDGSGVFHADYVSGWEEDFLQNVLNKCENEGEAAMPNFFCEDHLTFRDAPKCTNEETCDFGDPNLLKKLKNIQPDTPLDITGTIIAEETKSVKDGLPRGTCTGSLVGGDGGGDDDDNDDDNDDAPDCESENSKGDCNEIEGCSWLKKKKKCKPALNTEKCKKLKKKKRKCERAGCLWKIKGKPKCSGMWD